MKLEGIFVTIPGTVLAEVEEILGDTGITRWVKALNQWKDPLKGCIDAGGEYLETNEFDADLSFSPKDSFSGART
jgi:hypothetical protein